MLKINDALNLIAANNNLNSLLEQMTSFLMETSSCEAITAFIVDRLSGKLIFKTIKGRSIDEETFYERINVEKRIAESVLSKQKPQWFDENDPSEELIALRQIYFGDLQKILAYPFFNQSTPLVVILLYNPAADIQPLLEQTASRLCTEIDKAIEIELKDFRISRLQSLIDVIRQLGATLDREKLLRMIIDYARELLNVEACSLFLVDEQTGDLVLQLASNVDVNINQAVEQVRVPAGHGIIGYVVQTGDIVLVENAGQDARHYANVDQKSGFETRSILAVPLFSHTLILGDKLGKIKERIIGGLEAINKIGGVFNEDDKHLLSSFASQAATVLEIARLYAESNELFLDVIKALTAAIDAKDPYTVGHSQRVSDFSVEIAKELQLPPEDSQQLRIGSLLHDVGKIGIPDAILQKSGQLDQIEYARMKEHAIIGTKIMGQVRMLSNELPAMAQHHERLDGRGYPAQLTEAEISLFGKIVAVADVFDAMTSNRPYRKALTIEEAIEYLRGEIGTQFDHACVEALIRAYQKGKIQTQRGT